VCDDEARRLYVAPFGASGASLGSERGDEPGQTVAFFGLVRSGDALLAPGVDGLLYRFDGAGAPMTTPLPKLEAMGGIGVSFELPDVVLVLTGVNQRRSISGNVPLVVPR
ncbi:MAG TPA: hypothetical protein VMG12_00320, partial [Polyangiaceae bacterium]|nr:hypothetical protein [Polyangiaceae bacterium]